MDGKKPQAQQLRRLGTGLIVLGLLGMFFNVTAAFMAFILAMITFSAASREENK